ncbi:hypothetical protein TCE0_018r05765 [Talaromyces pinophilus]|uniref:Uncharacterized protein n=1 Tax=Talaromyces pinophilus TaxID=128442 RepID=A0A510NWH8_TALPI|nr:hypothetical protein TCE0_018r05765 [Talaromyces pinophilus]
MANSSPQGNAHAPSEFPNFHNGDVMVVINATEIYQLHSDVLRRCSPHHLGLLVAPANAANLIKAAVNSGRFTRYKLVLRASEGYQNGVFRREEVDRYGRTTGDTNCHSILANVYSAELPAYASESWKNLFRAFYNLEPDISGSSLQSVLEKAMHLMDAADSVGAAAAVRAHIDNSLMRHGQLLYRAILALPILWGNLAIRVESPSIFKDAVIHVVGKWNSLSNAEKRNMHPHFRAICEQKVAELHKIKGAVEMRIAGHFPKVIWRKAGSTTTTRANYANDIYMWMAVNIHRHWFLQVTGIERRGRDGLDGGAELYHAIQEGGATYLVAQDYVNFHNICPMSKKARTIVYDKVRQMKFEVRKFVKCLTVNRSQLDLKDDLKVDHLLCTEVMDHDLPWNITNVARLEPSVLEDGPDGMEVVEGGLLPDSPDIQVFESEIHRPNGQANVFAGAHTVEG